MTNHRTHHIFIRAFALIAMLLPALAALANTYYYKATAKAASPAAKGKVYVSTSNSCSDADYQDEDKTITGSTSSQSQTFYFFVKTDYTSDYNYVQWKSSSAIVSEGALTDGKHSFSKSLTISSTKEASPTTYTYTPYLQKVYVLGSCDGVKCTAVTVSPAINKLNTQVTLTATLADGYYVKYWINKNTGEIVESSCQDETMGQNPWTFKVWEEAVYEPVVGESWVTGSSANTSAGTVIVSPSANIEGDEVALIAVPKSGYYDVEWRKKGESEVVSTDNPFRLTVTEKAEYVATFVSGSNTLADGFYRVSCSNPTTSNTDIALVDNLFNMHAIVNSVTSFLNNSAPAVTRAQNQLAQDINLKTQDAALSSPNSIIYLKKVGSQYDLYAQGTHIKELSTGAFYGSNAGKVSSAGAYLDLSRAGDSYLMSLTIPAKAESYGVTQNMGPFYFSDNNGKFTVLESQDDHSLWLVEPIDQDDNYFAVQPNANVSLNGRYFTTLRLPFAVTIPAGSTLKAHGVTQMPETDGGQATLHTYEAGDVIPAGMPVVVENTSLLPADNKLMPTGDPSAAISTNSSYTVSTALYNNYGAHRHDNGRNLSTNSSGVDDVPMSGDQVGYFVMNPDYSDNIPAPTCYELGVNADGEIGFWTQVASQTKKVGSANVTYYPLDGCQAYSTMPCLLFSACEPTTLAELVASGDTEGRYEITDLTAVTFVDNDKVLICKDDNGASAPDVMDGGSDYMELSGFQGWASYDQSNWIALHLPEGTSMEPTVLGQRLAQVKGRLMAGGNPEFRLETVPTATGSNAFTPNTYVAASFAGTQKGINDKTYFFVRPKPMEYANIQWAFWTGSQFEFPPRVSDETHSWNQAGLQGEFAFNDAFLEGGGPVEGEVYSMDAIITAAPGFASAATSAPRRAGSTGGYVVYPFSLTKQGSYDGNIITAVDAVAAPRQVARVEYVGLSGRRSPTPWPGLNIIVTHYSDGTRQSVKSLF